MKIQILGRSSLYYPNTGIPYFDQGRNDGYIDARVNFKNRRENGEDKDNPKNLLLEFDGKLTNLPPEGHGDYISPAPYCSEYMAGLKDLAYFEAKDCNYLTRILKEGNLGQLEPAIWYLRETEDAQNIDIGEWWSKKLKLPTDELAKLLNNAEAIGKKYCQKLEIQKSNKNCMLVHLAAFENDIEILNIFVKHSSVVLNKKCSLGKTPLDYAYEAGKCEAISLLFDAKAEETIDKNKILVTTIETNNLAWLKQLIKSNANVNIQDSVIGSSILQKAILSDKDEIAKWLITESKINLELQSKEARTALHYAALKGKLELVELLIVKKVDLFVKDGLENTARDLAIKNEHADVAASLRMAMNKSSVAIQKPEIQEEKMTQIQINENRLDASLEEKALGSYVIEYSSLKYSMNNKLGEGGFGVVYKGRWQNIDVAIKELHLKNFSNETLDEFKREVEIMAKLRFPNIVNLYGVCLEPNKFSMVMELMPNGSLYDLLHNMQPLSWKIRFSISMDIATGLAYLHSKKILHRDLKSPNVLLDQNLRAKLADFGLAEVRHETMTTTNLANQGVGSLPWMPPELFQRKAKPTEAADIYSYGMILCEITSRKRLFEDAANPAILLEWIKSGEKETVPEKTPVEYKNILEWCWKAAKERPTANQIIEKLKANAKSIEEFDQSPSENSLLSGPIYKQ